MIKVLSSSGLGLTDEERAAIEQRSKIVNWTMLVGMVAAVVYLVKKRPARR
jgi:hypothetical protein